MSDQTGNSREDHNLDIALLIVRACLASLFIVVGFGIILSPEGFARGMAARGVPMAESLPYVAIIIEFCGGLVLLAGLCTRTMAALFILFVIVASLLSHHFWNMTQPAERTGNLIHFFKNIAIIGGFAVLLATGGGRYSLDHWLARRGRA